MNEIPEDDIEKVALVDLSEETKKGFLSKLIWVVIIIIILGGGFAIWKFVLNKSGDGIVDVEETKKAPPREPPPFGEIYMINDVIINPMSGRRHFIVSIGLEVHDKMANWIIEDDGTKSDPSHKARGKSWKSGTGISKDVIEKECSISSVEFIDSDDNSNVIEKICIKDKDLLILKCTSTDDQATIRLRNEIVGILNMKGFKQVD